MDVIQEHMENEAELIASAGGTQIQKQCQCQLHQIN